MKRYFGLIGRGIFVLMWVILLSSCNMAGDNSSSLDGGAVRQPADTVTPTGPGPTMPETDSSMKIFLDQLAEKGELSGAVLVAREGEILLKQAYGMADRKHKLANTPQTRFRIASITKQFTAAAILMLQAQGKLDVQDAICKYLADCPAAWQSVTIHHLLTHSSGIPNFTDLPDFAKTIATPTTPQQTIARVRDLPLEFSPGDRWIYNNSGYILLGQIIERVSGQSYEAFLQENIFTPLKMTSTGYDHNRGETAIGYDDTITEAPFIDMTFAYAAGGLYSTIEDLYRWDQALQTQALLPRALVDKLFGSYVVAQMPEWHVTESHYGYGWYIGNEAGRRVAAHSGGLPGVKTFIARYLDDKAVIIILSNQRDVKAEAIQKALAEHLFEAR